MDVSKDDIVWETPPAMMNLLIADDLGEEEKQG